MSAADARSGVADPTTASMISPAIGPGIGSARSAIGSADSRPDGGGLVDDIAERLGLVIEALGRRRVSLDELWRCLLIAEPSFVTAADKRLRLASALTTLAGVGRVELPGPRSYDAGSPRLPRSVLVASAARRGRTSPVARSFPWRPEIDWAADLRLAPGPLGMLKSVNTFLRDGGSERPDIPAQERSLMLFGDEKALNALAGTALFGPGRLSWEQIGRAHV